jgi:hypothetical protein
MRPLAASALVLFAVTLMVAVPFIGGSAEAAGTYTVSGKVVSGYSESGPLPLPGDVVVEIRDPTDGALIGSATVGGDGTYSVGSIAGGTYEIAFISTEKYGFLPISNGADIIRDSDGRYILNISGNLVVDAVMVDAMGTVTGTVTRSGLPVQGVIIQVIDPSGKVVGSDRTAGNGTYSIKCPVGNGYTVAVSSAYFIEDRYTVNIGVGDTIVQNFKVDVKETVTYLFDLDLTHSLMLVGGIMGLFLLIFVISYRIHIGKHPDSSKIHSEPKKKDKE